VDSTNDPIAAIVDAARARHAEQAAVLVAVRQFTARLYQAVEGLSRELVRRETPGVDLPRRLSVGATERLRFRWLDLNLAFVPHDEVALPPESYKVELRGRVGRVLLFQTQLPEDTGGRVLRDYLIDAAGTWHVRGVARAELSGPLSEEAARAHAIALFADLHSHLQEMWREVGEPMTFDDPNGGRAIGFHAE
jgi:hypothetical protein